VSERAALRHLLATLAYRGGKCLRDAPEGFARFDACGKTPVAILAHLGDLLGWSLTLAQGEGQWRNQDPLPWAEETARFYANLERLDQFLASEAPLQAEWQRLLAGPLADALTHVGQLAMLRRLAGAPLAPENYFKAAVTTGRVGPDPAAPPPRPVK